MFGGFVWHTKHLYAQTTPLQSQKGGSKSNLTSQEFAFQLFKVVNKGGPILIRLFFLFFLKKKHLTLHIQITNLKIFIMKNIFYLLLLFLSTQVKAQTNDNQTMERAYSEQLISGSFRHWAGQDSVNINFVFSPKVVTQGLVNMTLHTPTAEPLWLYVSDMLGNKLLEWKPQKAVHLHETKLNLRSLKPGTYQYHICFGKEQSIKTISFTKK
jgi:hypothetical protein